MFVVVNLKGKIMFVVRRVCRRKNTKTNKTGFCRFSFFSQLIAVRVYEDNTPFVCVIILIIMGA